MNIRFIIILLLLLCVVTSCRLPANVHYEKGVEYWQNGETDLALEEYDKAIEIDPDYYSAYSDKALILFSKEEFDLAFINLEKAIELAPVNWVWVVYDNRGQCYMQLRQYDKALIDFNQAIENNQREPSLYIHRASCYDNIGEYDLEIADLEKAIELDPELSETLSKQIERIKKYNT